MKPAGLSEGPVVSRAEKTSGSGGPAETMDFVLRAVEEDLAHRFHPVMEKKYNVDDVAAGREFTEGFTGHVVHPRHRSGR